MKYDIYEAPTEEKAFELDGDRCNSRALHEFDLRGWLNASYGESGYVRALLKGETVHIAPGCYVWLEEAMEY